MTSTEALCTVAILAAVNEAPAPMMEDIIPAPAVIAAPAMVVEDTATPPPVSMHPRLWWSASHQPWSGGHRGSTCRDRSTRASDYRVCGASTRRVRSTSASGNVHLPMSAVLVAPAPSVCPAPAPVAEHVSRCLQCSWREHMPCAMRLRQWWSIAETQRRCGVTPFLLLMRRQRHALHWKGESRNACRFLGASSSCAQRHRQWQCTSRDACSVHGASSPRACNASQWRRTSRDTCRARGASSCRARSVNASGRTHPAMPAESVELAPPVRAAPAPVAWYILQCFRCPKRKDQPCAQWQRRWCGKPRQCHGLCRHVQSRAQRQLQWWSTSRNAAATASNTGPVVCPVLEEFSLYSAGSGSTYEMPVLAVDNRFQVDMLYDVCWVKLCCGKAESESTC